MYVYIYMYVCIYIYMRVYIYTHIVRIYISHTNLDTSVYIIAGGRMYSISDPVTPISVQISTVDGPVPRIPAPRHESTCSLHTRRGCALPGSSEVKIRRASQKKIMKPSGISKRSSRKSRLMIAKSINGINGPFSYNCSIAV